MPGWRPPHLIASALAGTCTHTRAAVSDRPVLVAPAFPEGYYDACGPLEAPLRAEDGVAGEGGTVRRLWLKPRIHPALRAVPLADDPIELQHHAPPDAAGARRPLVLLSPILGNSTLLVARFARLFARHGIHAVIVQRKELSFDPRRSVAQAEDEVRLVVMRSRQALDWALAEHAIDPRRVGTFGISAGAIVSAMVAGADPRPSAHMWLLGGGPLSDVMTHTPEDPFHGYARAVIRSSGRTRSEIRDGLRRSLCTDPVRLAPHVARDGVLLVLARFDRSVPYRYGLALWRALGKPERVLVPLGHYTTFLLLPWLERRALQHFQRLFASRPEP